MTWNPNVRKSLGLCRTKHRVQRRYAPPIREELSLRVKHVQDIAEVDIGSNCFGGKGKVIGWCGAGFEVVGGLAFEHVPLHLVSAQGRYRETMLPVPQDTSEHYERNLFSIQHT